MIGSVFEQPLPESFELGIQSITILREKMGDEGGVVMIDGKWEFKFPITKAK